MGSHESAAVNLSVQKLMQTNLDSEKPVGGSVALKLQSLSSYFYFLA